MTDHMMWCQDPGSGWGGKSNQEHRPERTNQDAFTCSIVSQVPVPSRFMFYDDQLIQQEGNVLCYVDRIHVNK